MPDQYTTVHWLLQIRRLQVWISLENYLKCPKTGKLLCCTEAKSVTCVTGIETGVRTQNIDTALGFYDGNTSYFYNVVRKQGKPREFGC